MKKIYIFILLFLLLFVTSCSCKPKEKLVINEQLNKPIIIDDTKSIDDVEYKEIPLYIVNKMNSIDYIKTTNGKTTTKLLISYDQIIDSTLTKENSDYHLVTNSTSSLVKVYHEAYLKKDEVKVKEKESDEFNTLSLNDYVNEYGFNPYVNQIEGFVISEDTIISCLLVDKKEDESTYKLILDGNLAGDYNKIQMVKYGDLSDYPVFQEVVMYITINNDFIISSIDFESKYTIKYGIFENVKCVQNYNVIFTIESD